MESIRNGASNAVHRIAKKKEAFSEPINRFPTPVFLSCTCWWKTHTIYIL